MNNMKIKIAFIICVPVIIFCFCLIAGPRMINPFATDDISREILFSVRAPRSFVALLMGMALGASGAVLQGILKNPLADPYILGISSGASLAAVMGIMAGAAFLGSFTIPALAFSGALVTGAMVGIMGWKGAGYGLRGSSLQVWGSASCFPPCSCLL